MARRAETPSSPTSDLYGGEFRRGRSYDNWRPRGSGDWLLIYTVAGAGYLTTRAKQGPTRIGEAILYAPGDLQDYRTDPSAGHWHLLWAHFIPRPSWHPWLQWPTGPHGVANLQLEAGEVRDRFAAALRRLVQMHRRQFPQATDFAFNALEEALLWAHLAASRGRWMQLDLRVRKAMDYLVADLRRPFRLEDLARHCGLSISRLAHLFTLETGLSPQQFFEQHRMGYAAQLLRSTGLGVAEIAAETGYDDPFYFTHRFRRYSGHSPTAFRKRKNPRHPSPAGRPR